jgi:hypothetical protein
VHIARAFRGGPEVAALTAQEGPAVSTAEEEHQ